MKTLQKWIFIPALGFNIVCQGQVFQTADPNAVPRTITGTVYDPSGAPAPGVVLLSTSPGPGPNTQIKSDASGKYTVTWQARPLAGGGVGPANAVIARDLEHNFMSRTRSTVKRPPTSTCACNRG